MIIGHLGVAFAARARWPRLSVVWLTVVTMAPDLLRTVLATTTMSMNSTTVYSHLLPWSALLALALGVIAFALFRSSTAGAVTAAVVMSHILLDAISGRKPLWEGGPSGLNAQRYQQLEFVIEAALCWGGWLLMRRSSSPTRFSRRGVLAALLVFEAAFQTWSLQQRPYATRCWLWPMESCWKWRGERAPAPETGRWKGGKVGNDTVSSGPPDLLTS